MKQQVVVCDDDPSILNVIKDILDGEDFNVFTFANFDPTFASLKNCNPNLFILDIWMPKVDAREAVKLLRSNEHYKSIPIILISALNEAEAISKELKVEGFLRKPFNIHDLVTIVKKFTNLQVRQ